MVTVDENLHIASRSRYEVLAHFVLPESAWWNDYYRPLEERLSHLRLKHSSDSEALLVIAWSQEQIDLYRRFAACYGHVLYILRRRDSPGAC